MSAVAVFKDAWANRKSMGDENKERDLAAFLPAALEIQETPPNPIAKWMGRCLILLFTLAILWACFGHVNIVSSAEGKIIPSARIKQIQPLEKATVKRILVREAESVTQGQPLIELDGTLTLADEARLTSELNSATYLLAVSESMLQLLDMPLSQQNAITYSTLQLHVGNAEEPLTHNQNLTTVDDKNTNKNDELLFKRLLWQQWQDYRAQLSSLNSALAKTMAEKAMTQEVIIKLEQTLPIITKRAGNMYDLHVQNYATETDYLALEQERITQAQDLAAERQRLNQLTAGVNEVKQQINALIAQASAGQLSQITDVQRQIASLKEELKTILFFI